VPPTLRLLENRDKGEYSPHWSRRLTTCDAVVHPLVACVLPSA